jgi:aspartate aminotransferase-like enzyme
MFSQVLDDLRYVFQTSWSPIVLTSSGTGAMEAAVVNSLAPGAQALVLDAGRFAHRWAEICQTYGVEVIALDVPWGQAVDPEAVAELLEKNPKVEAVLGTLSETSTGVDHDVEAIGRVVAETEALLVVDGISGVGATPCRTEAWGIDLLAVGSQKALMLPPGLAFLSVSPKAWRKIEGTETRSFYFDLLKARAKLDVPDTPFTPAHTLIRALGVSLAQIRAEGIEAVWQRTGTLGRACRAGVQAMGLDVFAARPAAGVTAVTIPAELDAEVVRKRLLERFGVTIAGGQQQLKGKIVRIAHMGYLDALDLVGVLAAMELVLDELGHAVELGAAVAAAQRVLAEDKPGATVATHKHAAAPSS